MAKFITLLQHPILGKVFSGAGIIWLLLSLICWLCGSTAFLAEGTRRKVRSRLPGCLPFGQIYYTVRLANPKRSAGGTVFLLWWWLALSLLGGTLLIWALVFSTRGTAEGLILFLGGAGAILLGLGTLFYLFLRITEFKALARMLTLKQWFLSLVFTLMALPIQRIFLHYNFKNQIIEEKSEA